MNTGIETISDTDLDTVAGGDDGVYYNEPDAPQGTLVPAIETDDDSSDD